VGNKKCTPLAFFCVIDESSNMKVRKKEKSKAPKQLKQFLGNSNC
jgi:hypothetical protein